MTFVQRQEVCINIIIQGVGARKHFLVWRVQIPSTSICPTEATLHGNSWELPCRVVWNAILGHSTQPSPYVEFPPTVKTLCDS